MNAAIDAGDLAAALLLDAAVVDDPYPFYRRLVAEAPVWCVPDSDIVVVSSHSAVTEVASRVDDFSSNMHAILYRGERGTPELLPFGSDGFQTLAIADPPMHTKHRRTVFPELVARRMSALRPDVEALAGEHLDRALSKPRFEAMDELANAIPIRVVSRLIGFPHADPARLLAAAFDSTDMLAATRSLDGKRAAGDSARSSSSRPPVSAIPSMNRLRCMAPPLPVEVSHPAASVGPWRARSRRLSSSGDGLSAELDAHG